MSAWLSHRGSSLRVERFLRVVLACMAVLLAGGCEGLGSPGDPTGTRRGVVERINSARMQARLCGSQVFHAASPLRWNGTLAASSLRHARDLARNGLAGHIGSDGSRPQERIAEAGYPAQATGEIVAVGTASLSTVMQAWLDSPGHCAVLMNPHFTEAGAAVAADRFWTVDFGTPLNPP